MWLQHEGVIKGVQMVVLLRSHLQRELLWLGFQPQSQLVITSPKGRQLIAALQDAE